MSRETLRNYKTASCAIAALCLFSYGVQIYRKDWWPAPLINDLYRQLEERGQRKEAVESDQRLPDKAKEREIKNLISNATSTVLNQKKMAPGSTLLCMGENAAVLIGANGEPKHIWHMPFDKVWSNPSHIDHEPVPNSMIFFAEAHAYPNGDLLAVYQAKADKPNAYGLVKLDKGSNILWSQPIHAHNSLYIAHNSDIYTLEQKILNNPPEGFTKNKMLLLADDIVQLSPEGNEKDRISIIESFIGTPYQGLLYTAPTPGKGGRRDITQATSIMLLDESKASKFPMFKAGQMLVSLRSLSTIAVIDPETRKVVWATRGVWRNQQEAKFLNNGHILIFDNQGFKNADTDNKKPLNEKSLSSRILELNPQNNEITWNYTASEYVSFYSSIGGSVQKLPNGNYLALESLPGRKIMEITPDKETVWRYDTNVNNSREMLLSVWKAHRYTPDYFSENFLQKE